MINVFLVFLVGLFFIILFAVCFMFEFNKNQKLKKYIITKYNDIFDEQRIPTDYTGEFDIKLGVNKTPTKLLIEDGLLHSDHGPSYIDDNVNRWHHKGLLHRLDGPAVFYYKTPNSEHHEYWINGDRYNKNTYWAHPLVAKHKLEKIVKDL